MKPQTSPCKECNSRAIGCHGLCEKYAEWKGQHEDIKKEDRQDWTNRQRYKPRRRSHRIKNSIKKFMKGV